MHDPTTLAHSLKRPWPEIRLRPDTPVNDARGWFHWQVRLFSRRRYISPFIYVGKYELYFPSAIDIWHTDPLGDAGPACHGRKYWKWHIHHLSIQWTFVQRFIQRHVTKCAWCGKRSNKELGLVNHSDGRTVYHADCSSRSRAAMHAHDPATCWNCKNKPRPADPEPLSDSQKVRYAITAGQRKLMRRRRSA